MAANRFFQRIGLIAGRRNSAGKKRRVASSASSSAAGSLGRYLLQDEIGRGAMGEVWRAVDPRIARIVAVKILKVPEGGGAAQKADWEQRFVREARTAGMLSHPGIVSIHDVGMTEDGRPFIVMELVEGRSLDAVIRDGPRPSEREALDWGAQVAEALDAAHSRGVVHRDVKPANVLINEEGRARIADFGIARLSESDLTHTGLFVGSPAYASPEQIGGGVLDGRSDLFSLGAVIYQLLSGERPFRGDDLSSLAYAICHVDPPPPRRSVSSRSPAAEAVVMKALAKDPNRRFRTGREMAEYLRAAAERSPEDSVYVASPGASNRPSPRHRSPVYGRAAMVVAFAMVLFASTLGVPWMMRQLGASSPKAAWSAAPASEPGPWVAENGAARPAVVTVQVVHELPDGVLTIWSGKRRLLRVGLEPAEASGATAPGTLSTGRAAAEWQLRLPGGEHVVRVRVASDQMGLDLQQELPTIVQHGQRSRLHVRVRNRPRPKLELMWTGD